jgi:flagellin
VSITATITGGQLTITNASGLGGVSTAISSGVATTAGALSLLTAISAQELIVGQSLGTLGGASKSIDFLTSFTKTLSDAVTEGLGALVDADLAKESAQLQALQVKQQLGISALSIANQRPETLLSLMQ